MDFENKIFCISDMKVKYLKENYDLQTREISDDAVYCLMLKGFKEKQAQKIENWIYENYHHCINDYLHHLEEISDLIYDVITIE